MSEVIKMSSLNVDRIDTLDKCIQENDSQTVINVMINVYWEQIFKAEYSFIFVYKPCASLKTLYQIKCTQHCIFL